LAAECLAGTGQNQVISEENMTDYQVNVGQRSYQVTINKDQLLVNGSPLEVKMESLNGNGLHVLRQPNRNVETYLQANRNGYCDVQISGNHLCAEVVPGHRRQITRKNKTAGDIFSPMPGIIVDIPVKMGDQVEKGQPILIQEAMKMQMKIRTPQAGTVARINTAVNNQVNKGDLLVVIKSDENNQ
jgi:biotin carboxyl carrier protein